MPTPQTDRANVCAALRLSHLHLKPATFLARLGPGDTAVFRVPTAGREALHQGPTPHWREPNFPSDLSLVLTHAYALGCTRVLVSEDGPKDADLPLYEQDWEGAEPMPFAFTRPQPLDCPTDYVLALPQGTRVWLSVDCFSVTLKREDEGIVVDVYALGREDEETLGSTYVFESDCQVDDEPADTSADAAGDTVTSAAAP